MPTAIRRCGTPTARAGLPFRIWASSARTGRSPGPAISTGGRSAFYGATSNGDTALWNPNGSGGFAFHDLGIVGNDWQVAGTGDFTGSGESSILWRNANGDTELWNPNGSGGFVGADLGVVGNDWKIAGTGDFTGTGEAAFCGAIPTAIRRCGIPTARVGSPSRIWGSSARAGRSPGPAISAGVATAAFYGATPMATRRYGIPTARAASPFRIWAPSTAAGQCTKFSLETGVSRATRPPLHWVQAASSLAAPSWRVQLSEAMDRVTARQPVGARPHQGERWRRKATRGLAAASNRASRETLANFRYPPELRSQTG